MGGVSELVGGLPCVMGGVVRVVVVVSVEVIRSTGSELINGEFVAVVLSSPLKRRVRHWEEDEAPSSTW